MEAWSNANTFIGSSQHIGQLCRLHKSICEKKWWMGVGSLEGSIEFMKNPVSGLPKSNQYTAFHLRQWGQHVTDQKARTPTSLISCLSPLFSLCICPFSSSSQTLTLVLRSFSQNIPFVSCTIPHCWIDWKQLVITMRSYF